MSMKVSVCIESVFAGVDACEAMRRVKAAGYGAYEFWGWGNKDIGAMAGEAERLGLETAAFSVKSGSLVDAGQRAACLEGLKESIPVAKRLRCPKMIVTGGADTGEPRGRQRESLVLGLRQAAPYLEEAGITLLLEPLNSTRDHPGVYLVRSDEAAEVLEEVGSPFVKCLFDIYHQQISEGDVLANIKKYLPLIGHFHSAGNPGRHELYDGELDYRNIARAVDGMGYDGFFGLEYVPSDPVEEGLAKTRELLELG